MIFQTNRDWRVACRTIRDLSKLRLIRDNPSLSYNAIMGTPNSERFQIGSKVFSPGDRVLQLRSNYDNNVFNGDHGVIHSIDTASKCLYVQFDAALIQYEYKDVDDLSLAYAITVHKSQGSESPAVIIPVTIGHYIMLQQNLLYTAITRAKKMCVLVGEKKALGIALKSTTNTRRNTFLLRNN